MVHHRKEENWEVKSGPGSQHGLTAIPKVLPSTRELASQLWKCGRIMGYTAYKLVDRFILI